MTHYTEANVQARIDRLRAIERRDPDKFRPSPLGPGFITRYGRYTEAFRELTRRLKAIYAAEAILANDDDDNDEWGRQPQPSDRERFNCNQ